MATKPLHTEKRPAKEAPFPPAGGIPYKVMDDDRWESVARMFALDVKKLIHFNFLTDDPGVVNWYLREKVGCKIHDGNNWHFSKEASPGIIYRPNQGAVVPLTPPKNPTPAAWKRPQDWTVKITAKDAGGDWIFNVFVGLDGKWFSDDPDVGKGVIDISDIRGSGGTALKAGFEIALSLSGHKFIEREKKNNGIGSPGMGRFNLDLFGPRKLWARARQNVKPDFHYTITEVPN